MEQYSPTSCLVCRLQVGESGKKIVMRAFQKKSNIPFQNETPCGFSLAKFGKPVCAFKQDLAGLFLFFFSFNLGKPQTYNYDQGRGDNLPKTSYISASKRSTPKPLWVVCKHRPDSQCACTGATQPDQNKKGHVPTVVTQPGRGPDWHVAKLTSLLFWRGARESPQD